jgi:chromate transporter
VIIGAALVGIVGGALGMPAFRPRKVSEAEAVPAYSDESRAPPTWRRSLRVATICLLLWWTPVLLAGLWLGWDSLLVKEGVFFSKAAMVTFGGAYAVLPYVAQLAVEKFGWLSAPQMLSGLGLAETTPGPLIMVVLFVGFLGGWHNPEPLTPLGMATLGALLTTWVTFVPCFMWIFIGAPYVERLYGSVLLSGALAAITAAVVGVIANLAVWFGAHVLAPDGRLDWFALVIGVVVLVGLFRWKWNVVPVVLGAGLAGLIYRVLSS